MGVLDAPMLSKAVADKRYSYRRRSLPPIGATLSQPLSAEAFSPAISFTSTAPTISNSINLTYLTAQPLITAHGAVLAQNATFSYLYNTINGSTTGASWAAGLEYYGAHVAFKFRTSASTAQYWIFIDDKPVTATPVSLTGLSVGVTYYLDLPFTTTAWRRIKVWVATLNFQGFICTKTDAYGPHPVHPFNILFWGDSWYQGANGILLDHTPLKIARALGAEPFLCAQGGTGYCNAGPGSGSSVYGSTDRLAGAAPLTPDLIWVNGSVNDQSFAASVQAAATAFFAGLAVQFPGVPVLVQGVQSISSGAGFATNHNTANTAVLTAAAGASNVIGTINPRGETWITGSGNSAVTTADGNADLFMAPDYIHLTSIGNDYYARRSIAKAAALLAA